MNKHEITRLLDQLQNRYERLTNRLINNAEVALKPWIIQQELVLIKAQFLELKGVLRSC